jgi:hypothetical protein
MERQLLGRSCCTTPAAMCFWAAIFVLIYGAGLLLTSVWPQVRPFEDTLILVALAAACAVNFWRNRTLHCGITGPLFLVGAVAAALIEAGAWRFDLAIVWGVVLLGVGIAFIVEWRTVGRAAA